jgi:magnesium-transporting ATPase (P-type)
MSDELSLAMSVCHSLTSSKTGIIGNPVDMAMFHASGAVFVQESGPDAVIKLLEGKHVKIIRRFEFDHIRMTQGVIVEMPDGHLKAIVKGSWDKLCNMCEVPESYNETVEAFSSFGYYQIAVAWKDVESMDDAIHLNRDDVERNLMFVGVLNFENRIRDKATQVIDQLRSSGVDAVMLTGDSLLTGIHVAREAKIILPDGGVVVIGRLNNSGEVIWLDGKGEHLADPFEAADERGSVQIAMTGEAWQVLLKLDREYARRLSGFLHLVARCSPQDKVAVVETFVGLGFTTMMCGDGGNDCGALKAAHIGIALSDSDASLVAPFTSLDKDIESVLTILREGRCALASTTALYKFIVLYGNITSYVQAITYNMKSSFSDWTWLVADGVWTVSLYFALPAAGAASKLSSTRPTASILGWEMISSIVGITGCNYIFMAVALSTLFREDWFQCRKWNPDEIYAGTVLLPSDNYETQVTFLMFGYQCMFAAVTFNFGYEFRQAWWRNYPFVAVVSVFLFVHVYITLVPGRMSCFWRVNCVDEYVLRGVLDPTQAPIGNPFHSTVSFYIMYFGFSDMSHDLHQVMPPRFRWKLVLIAFCNGLAILFCDYFCVNVLRRWLASGAPNQSAFLDIKGRHQKPELMFWSHHKVIQPKVVAPQP